MRDERLTRFAKMLVEYSCSLQPGEKILIEDRGIQTELTEALVEAVYRVGGIPVVRSIDLDIERAVMMGATKEQLMWMAENDAKRMREVQAYIGIRGGNNAMYNADVPQEQKKLYSTYYSQPVHSKIRVPHTKWVALRYPTPAMAQSAGMSTRQFEDYYFDVCMLDYEKMSQAMNPLVELMNRTDKVHIVGPGTDLRFSIKNIPAIKCDGRLNVPDGEIYTAPVKDSVQGVLCYNIPTLYQGVTHENMRLVFEKGRIVEATSSQTEIFNQVLDTDEGARYIGEFAIGVNPYITFPIKDTLFDEKIAGSFHFTPGNCYDEASNGNKSAVHWDMIVNQTKEWGGGEMYFDGVLIRKDGLFVLDELKGLNPENLK
ncbi:MAG TPA: aminopeptidase [Clostridiales bacterium]|jgi:aminopeptidase|nr:aminopeptidase [Clostridiales bacterium]